MKASRLVNARHLYAAYKGYLEALALNDEDLRLFIYADVRSGLDILASAVADAAVRASTAILIEIRAALKELIAEKKSELEDLGVEFPPEGKDE